MHTNLDVQHSLEILQAAVALANGVGMRRGYDKAQFDGWNGDEAEAVLLGEKYGVELDPKRPMRTVRKIFNM